MRKTQLALFFAIFQCQGIYMAAQLKIQFDVYARDMNPYYSQGIAQQHVNVIDRWDFRAEQKGRGGNETKRVPSICRMTQENEFSERKKGRGKQTNKFLKRNFSLGVPRQNKMLGSNRFGKSDSSPNFIVRISTFVSMKTSNFQFMATFCHCYFINFYIFKGFLFTYKKVQNEL